MYKMCTGVIFLFFINQNDYDFLFIAPADYHYVLNDFTCPLPWIDDQ